MAALATATTLPNKSTNSNCILARLALEVAYNTLVEEAGKYLNVAPVAITKLDWPDHAEVPTGLRLDPRRVLEYQIASHPDSDARLTSSGRRHNVFVNETSGFRATYYDVWLRGAMDTTKMFFLCPRNPSSLAWWKSEVDLELPTTRTGTLCLFEQTQGNSSISKISESETCPSLKLKAEKMTGMKSIWQHSSPFHKQSLYSAQLGNSLTHPSKKLPRGSRSETFWPNRSGNCCLSITSLQLQNLLPKHSPLLLTR
jgi:hypothetical protein